MHDMFSALIILAASEFSSMMKEMESHSKKAQPPTSPKHTVLRYSQQSLSKQRESRGSHVQSSANTQDKELNQDDFAAAVDALSKLEISPRSGTQAHTPQQQSAGRDDQGEAEGGIVHREFSPSVAAVFNAAASESTVVNAHLKTPNSASEDFVGKTIMQGRHSSPRQMSPGNFPDAFQKLMHPPLQRSPLLPNPAYYQPHLGMRGVFIVCRQATQMCTVAGLRHLQLLLVCSMQVKGRKCLEVFHVCNMR